MMAQMMAAQCHIMVQMMPAQRATAGGSERRLADAAAQRAERVIQ